MTPKIKYLGDVHLGRSFRQGVPLHRRGERENMVRNQFFEELNTGEFDALIQVGDLNDKFRIELNEAVWAADRIRHAANSQPEKQFFFLAGNHDLARDTEKISSFELVARLCQYQENVTFVVKDPLVVCNGTILLIPWSPIKSAAELIEPFKGMQFPTIVGHWDQGDIGGDFNLIPLDALAKMTKQVVSGHDHVAREYKHGKMTVKVTGSMQPLSHSEDREGKLYVTMSLVEAASIQPHLIKDKCLRILAAPGEAIPELDCLQLTVKRTTAEDEDLDVGFDDGFNMDGLFTEAFVDVDGEIAKEVKLKLDEVIHA